MTAELSPRSRRAIASPSHAPAPKAGTQFRIGHLSVGLHYNPDLARLGSFGYGYGGWGITLREWNERVFLHEVLHAAVQDWWHAEPDAACSPNEHIVQTVEDALWDMGWRWHPDLARNWHAELTNDKENPDD